MCGPRSDLLRAGLDQLPCQAAAGDPPGLFVTVQVWQAETLPAHHRPLCVHALQLLLSCTGVEREGRESYGFYSVLKKGRGQIRHRPAL